MNDTLKLTFTLSEIDYLAKTLLKQNWIINGKTFNLHQLGWKFEFNNYKRALGLCRKTNKTIYLSRYLFNSNNDDLEIWNDTIKHEIAHAIDYEIRNKSDHGSIWKNIAKQVGCVPSSCHKGAPLKRENAKYTYICDSCQKEVAKYRKSKNDTACGTCCKKHNSGNFSYKYVFRIVQNY